MVFIVEVLVLVIVFALERKQKKVENELFSTTLKFTKESAPRNFSKIIKVPN